MTDESVWRPYDFDFSRASHTSLSSATTTAATAASIEHHTMAEETAAKTNGEADAPKDNGKQNRKKEDQKPIEELYDLSQPIPRVSFSCNDCSVPRFT